MQHRHWHGRTATGATYNSPQMLQRKDASREKRDLCSRLEAEKCGGVRKAYSSVGMGSEEVFRGGAVEDVGTVRAFGALSGDGFVAFSIEAGIESTRTSFVITFVASSRSMPPGVFVPSIIY
eukprot:CCRYP_000533-RA/>CCRYP_000533-RA protein AED:0.43 eAED:0.96 QI:8/0/0.5/1/0/0/2/0/121